MLCYSTDSHFSSGGLVARSNAFSGSARGLRANQRCSPSSPARPPGEHCRRLCSALFSPPICHALNCIWKFFNYETFHRKRSRSCRDADSLDLSPSSWFASCCAAKVTRAVDMREHRGRGKTKIGRKSAAAQGTKALRGRQRASGGDGKGGKRAYSRSPLFCTQTRTTTELNKMYVIAPLILFSFSLHIIELRQCLCARRPYYDRCTFP